VNPNDPESVRAYISRIRCTMVAYREAGRTPERSPELYEKVMKKIPIEIQRKWVSDVPKPQRSLDALILFLTNWARDAQDIPLEVRNEAMKNQNSNPNPKNAAKGGGQGGPQGHVVTTDSAKESNPAGKGKKGKGKGRGKAASSTGGPATSGSSTGGPTQSNSSTGGPQQAGSSDGAPRSYAAAAAGQPDQNSGNRGRRPANQEPKPIYPPGFCPIHKAVVHDLETCPDFLALDPDNRIYRGMSFRVHMACLKTCDGPNTCPRRYVQCGVQGCDRFHHPVLHGARCRNDWYHSGPPRSAGPTAAVVTTGPPVANPQNPGPIARCVTICNTGPQAQKLALPDFGHHLRLLYVDVRKIGGPRRLCRRVLALFDGGCSRTFINDDLVKELQIPQTKFHLTINSFHGPQEEVVATVNFEVGPVLDGPGIRHFYEIHNACSRHDLTMSGPAIDWPLWAVENPPFDKISDKLHNVDYRNVQLYIGLDQERLTLPTGPAVSSADEKFLAYESLLGWTIAGPWSACQRPSEISTHSKQSAFFPFKTSTATRNVWNENCS